MTEQLSIRKEEKRREKNYPNRSEQEQGKNAKRIKALRPELKKTEGKRIAVLRMASGMGFRKFKNAFDFTLTVKCIL